MSTKPDISRNTYYEIQVSSQIDPNRAEWLGNLSLRVRVTPEGSSITVLSGPVTDQAALFGILNRIRDMGLRLISVNVIEPQLANEVHSDLDQEESR